MVKRINSNRVFDIVNYTVVTLFLLSVSVPLVYIVSASFSDAQAVTSGRVFLWPIGFNLEGYKAVFRNARIMLGYGNSLFYMVAGTSINIILTVLAAYPLSRKDYKPRNIIMFLFAFTMIFFPGMIPNYLLIKQLNIYDTRWAMLLPQAIIVWNLIITRTYFQTNIPESLLDAAKIDGCDDFRFLTKIVIPLSKPIIAIIGLFYGVRHWNVFMDALLYLRDDSLYPLQLILRDIFVANETSSDMLGDIEGTLHMENLRVLLKYSLIVVANIPLLLLYPFIQRYFVKGIMVGAIKG